MIEVLNSLPKTSKRLKRKGIVYHIDILANQYYTYIFHILVTASKHKCILCSRTDKQRKDKVTHFQIDTLRHFLWTFAQTQSASRQISELTPPGKSGLIPYLGWLCPSRILFSFNSFSRLVQQELEQLFELLQQGGDGLICSFKRKKRKKRNRLVAYSSVFFIQR